MKPEYISKEDISEEKLNELMEIFKKEADSEGKPKEIAEKIVEGKLNKYFEEKCLLEQKWFKDDGKKVSSLIEEGIQKLGEPITVSRILVWEL